MTAAPIPSRARRARKRTFTVVLVLAILGMVALGVALLGARSKAPPPAASISAADKRASLSLVEAAAAVAFRPTTLPGIGKIESQPASAAENAPSPHLLRVGSQAPAFTLHTPTGERVSLADFRGRATLLEFFATWCPHCNAEAPHLERLYASLPATRYAFVALNADSETAPSVFAYHVYHGLRFPALIDPGGSRGSFLSPGGPGRVTSRYRVYTFPTFYVLDGRGRVVWRGEGEQPDALLRQELRRAGAR